jgi:hypothetical protein
MPPPRRRFDDDLFEGFDSAPPQQEAPIRRFDDDLFEGFDPAPAEESNAPDWIGTGLRVVPGVIGGAISTLTGGSGAAFGAAGGAIGELAGQTYERISGQRDSYNPTQIGVQTALGAIPGVGLGKHLTGAAGLLARGAVNTGYGAVVGGVTNPLVERVEEEGLAGLNPVDMLADPELGERVTRGAGMGAVFGAGAGLLGEGISAIANRRMALKNAEIEAGFDPSFDRRQQPPPVAPPVSPQASPPSPVTSPVTPEPVGVLPPTIPSPPPMALPAPIPAPLDARPAPAPMPPAPVIGRATRSYGDEFDELMGPSTPPAQTPEVLPAEAPAQQIPYQGENGETGFWNPDGTIAEGRDLEAMFGRDPNVIDVSPMGDTRMDVDPDLRRLMADSGQMSPDRPETLDDEVNRLIAGMGTDAPTFDVQNLDDELVGVGVNASGESMASAEAISRLSGMADRGERFAVRTRGGFRDLPVDAVDYRARAGEEYGVIDADGNFRVLDRGENAPTAPAGRAPRAAATRDALGSTRADAAEPGGVYRMAPTDLDIDPKAMQYKGGADEQGVTESGRIQGPWDKNAEGVVLAWKNPATGRLTVINGHHRVEAAKRLGVDNLTVRVIEGVDDAAGARAAGALTNIKEERGTPVDVAKLIRDSGFTPQMFREAGIPGNSTLSRQGFDLATLPDGIFTRVAMGEIEPAVAAAASGGRANPLPPEAQAAVLQMVERQANRPQPRILTPAQVQALAEEVRAATSMKAANEAQGDIFGLLGDENFQSTAVEKADLRAWLKSQFAGVRRDFGAVSNKARAARVAEAGNTLAVDENAARANAAKQDIAALEAIGSGAGPLNDALEDAARRILAGESPNGVRSNLLTAAREALGAELGRKTTAPPESGIPLAGDRGGADDQPSIFANDGDSAATAQDGAEAGAARPARIGRKSDAPAAPVREVAPPADELAQWVEKPLSERPNVREMIGPNGEKVQVERVSDEATSDNPTTYNRIFENGRYWMNLSDKGLTTYGFKELPPPSDPLVDLFSTGEAQPRLPGDVGEVRNKEVATPREEAPFSLENEIARTSAPAEPDMFGGRTMTDAELAPSRDAAKEFSEAQRAYRAREIDDATFLAARKKFEQSGEELDRLLGDVDTPPADADDPFAAIDDRSDDMPDNYRDGEYEAGMQRAAEMRAQAAEAPKPASQRELVEKARLAAQEAIDRDLAGFPEPEAPARKKPRVTAAQGRARKNTEAMQAEYQSKMAALREQSDDQIRFLASDENKLPWPSKQLAQQELDRRTAAGEGERVPPNRSAKVGLGAWGNFDVTFPDWQAKELFVYGAQKKRQFSASEGQNRIKAADLNRQREAIAARLGVPVENVDRIARDYRQGVIDQTKARVQENKARVDKGEDIGAFRAPAPPKGNSSERGSVNIRALAPIAGGVTGAATGAATADEDATPGDRLARAAAFGLAGAALGTGATRLAGQIARRGPAQPARTGRPASGTPDASTPGARPAAGTGDAPPAPRRTPREPGARARGDDLLDIDRFEKYADEGGTEEAMRAAASQIPASEVAAWKGVSTDEMMRQAASELDMTAAEMRQLQGDISNIRERVMAMRGINKGAFTRARELAEAVRSDPANAQNLAQFNAALDGWLGVQRSFTGSRAEAGRFLRDFRQMSIDGMSATDLQTVLDDISAPQSQERIAAIADRLLSMDPNDLRRANRFVQEAKKATTGEKVHRLWLNLLLSGPKTHIANIVSTGLSAGTLPMDRTAAGFLDLVRAKGTGSQQERFVREGAYTAIGMMNGIMPALRAGLKTMATGQSSFGEALSRAGDVTSGAPSTSILSDGPFIRALKAQDEVWKSVVEAGDLYGRAARQALREGARGQALSDRMAAILDNPSKELKQASQKEALYRTFNANPGEIGKWLIRGRKLVPGASVVFPFLNTPINIAKFGVQHTPLYAGKILHDLAKGKYKNAPGKLQDELAKVVTGSLLATGVAAAYQRGWITGGGRPERSKHATDVAARPDYSVKVGNNWYSYQRLEPLGMSMGLVADYMELLANKDQDDSQASKVIYSFARNLGSKTFLQAASDLFEALTDPNGYKRDRFLSNLAGSVVPTIISDAARVVDPVQRRTRGAAERIQQRIPGQSSDLRPVVNIFGEQVSEGHVSAAERFLSPVRRRPVVDDPLLDEMRRLGIDLDVPSDKLTTKEPMSDGEKSTLVQAKGQATKRAIQKVIDRPAYQRADDGDREELINKAINNARDDVSRRARFRKKTGRELTLEDLLGVR